MLLLTIDSSTSAGSIALIRDQKVVAKSILNLQQTQSQRLMPQIVNLLDATGYQPGDLKAVAVGVGPGSFTGMRIGIATAKTLAQALDLPIVGVSTLAAIAYRLRYSKGYILALLNSNRNNLFAGIFHSEGQELKREAEDALISMDDLAKELAQLKERIYITGEYTKAQDLLAEKLDDLVFTTTGFNLPDPVAIAELAEQKLALNSTEELYKIEPNYLKRSQAEISWTERN